MFRRYRRWAHHSTNRRTQEANNVSRHWHEKHGSTSDWAGVIIGALVALFTIALFYQTQKATNAAVRSASAADSTYREQRLNDSITRRRDSVKERIDSIVQAYHDSVNADNMRRQFTFQRKSNEAQVKSVEAQIQSLREAQKDFELENRPFIQVSEMKMDTLGYNGILSFKIFNYGKFPADVLYVKYRLGMALNTKPNEIVYVKWITNERKIYVASGNNYLPEFQYIQGSPSNTMLKMIKKGEITVYFDIEIKYKTYGIRSSFLHNSSYKITRGDLIENIRNDDIATP